MTTSKAFLRAITTPALADDIAALAATPVLHRVRQTVAFGPVTSAGLPDFLPATSASLSLASQNLATDNLVVIAANGGDTRRGVASANLTWASLAANATNYLYVDVAADGTVVAGSTTVAPVYQAGGSFSTAAGAFTFNINAMVGKVGNGAAAAPAWRVFVGEANTGASTVTATIAYAYNGRYASAWAAFAVNTLYTHNHNIGCYPRGLTGLVSNKSDGVCSAAGDIVNPMNSTGYLGSNASGSKSFWLDRNTLRVRALPNILYATATDGATSYATDAGLYAQLVVDRGW